MEDIPYQAEGQDQQFGFYRIIQAHKLQSDHVCYFAAHSSYIEYPDYLFFYLESINDAGFEIIFTSSSPIGRRSLERIKSSCRIIIEKENKGVDFGAWKIALELTQFGTRFKSILLANDSVLGPFSSLQPILQKFNALDVHFYGLTQSLQRSEHIQSYFILIKNELCCSREWKSFWNNLACYPKKDDIIDNYEINFTKTFLSAGFKYAVWSNWLDKYDEVKVRAKICKNSTLYTHWGHAFSALKDRFITDINPCAFFWKELIEQFEFPFLKRELLLYSNLNAEYAVFKTWKPILQSKQYPLNLVSQVISLGEIKKVLNAFPLNSDSYDYHFSYSPHSAFFSNFTYIFPNSTMVNDDDAVSLRIVNKSTKSAYLFELHFLTEKHIDRIILEPDSFRHAFSEIGENTLLFMIPYSNEVIPFLKGFISLNMRLFEYSEEYESAVFKEIQRTLTSSATSFKIPHPKSSFDISDLRIAPAQPDTDSVLHRENQLSESETYFNVLHSYHRTYESLPMWYKKIGQLFKIASGNKKVYVEMKNRKLKVKLKHRKEVDQNDKLNFIRNWYYHEYDVLPGWYKKIGKKINKIK